MINKSKSKKKLNRKIKFFIASSFDFISCFISLIIALNINSSFSIIDEIINTESFLYICLLSISLIFIYLSLSIYQNIIRYINESYFFYRLAISNLLFTFFTFFVDSIISNRYSFGFYTSLFITLNFFTYFSRLIARDLIRNLSEVLKIKRKNKAVIYGAGSAGIQLLSALQVDMDKDIFCFIDDNQELWNRQIKGKKIISIEKFEKIYHKFDCIYFAIPSLNSSQQKEIFLRLKKFNLKLFKIPSIKEISSGAEPIDRLQPINVSDLLGRQSVSPSFEKLSEGIFGKSILVTGAGGSIGSELAKQISKLNPKRLVILERNEASLYNLLRDLSIIENCKIVSVLGSCENKNLVKKVIQDNSISTIYHTAAYKHVPIVEDNPLVGLSNNILSTINICEAAKEGKASNVILISSDKAVRPTNVMGASKRVCELIIQAMAEKENEYSKNGNNEFTKFSAVRFGNVLGSSGSVVPLFQSQISNGGPVTLTHPEINRYFMTIEEASQLVIQASSMSSKGGNIYLLDMGKPIKILDLAKMMISLSGLTLKTESNINGDIEIVYKGLRPGEKLYEELLIDSQALKTTHPSIFEAKEPFYKYEELWPKLRNLIEWIEQIDKKNSLKVLKELVPDWKS